MASPDVAGYTGIELADVSAQELVTTAIANLAATWPEWNPREGNTEVVLLEQLAVIAETIGYQINQLPDGIAEVLLRLFTLTRDPGAPATGSVTFTVADADGYTIPAGTLVRANVGEEPVDFATDEDLLIAAGAVTGTVAVTAQSPGTVGNGQPVGRLLELLDAVTSVNTVQVAATTGGGRNPEDGAAFLQRATPTLSRLTTTVVRPPDVEAYVASLAVAHRIKCLDLYDPLSDGEPGDHPGYVTVAVATAGGGALPALTKESLLDQLEDAMHAGLKVAVVDADVTVVDVNVSVLRRRGYDDADVEAAVLGVLEAYLNPDSWDWSRLVRVNELIAQVDTAAGVDVVLAITTPAADLPLPGNAPLAKLGAVTVTVEAP